MGNHIFFTKPLPVFAVLKKLAELAAELFPQVRLTARTSIGDVNIPEHGHMEGKALAEDPAYKQLLGMLESRQFVDSISIAITAPNNDTVRYEPDPGIGAAQIAVNLTANDTNRTIHFTDAAAQRFNLSRRAEITLGNLPEEQKQMLRASQQVINDFAAESARLSLAATKQATDVGNLLREKTAELDKRFADKETELESRYRKKADDLEGREKEHAETLKQFELRNNTVVRRDLLKEIGKIITEQKKIQISLTTVWKRVAVHIICISTMLAAGVLCYFFAHKVLTETTTDWRMFVPLSAGTLLFVSTGIYYVRWNDRWFRDHATAEFTNRKFGADILRASWLAELFFEWDSKKNTEFPKELWQAFARGLFVNDSTSGSDPHPFEQLTGVLNDFQSLRVGKGLFEIARRDSKPGTAP